MTVRLYTFAISHYCEKARWALDWHRIAFEEVGWPPGLHVPLARRAGAAGSALPILHTADTLLQGSGAIIDWTERQAGNPAHALTPDRDAEAAATLERRADEALGVQVRRFLYAQLLPREGWRVKPYLLANTSAAHRLLGNLI